MSSCNRLQKDRATPTV